MILVTGSAIKAQSSQLIAADRLYYKHGYAHAIPFYERGLKKFIEPGAAARLADCYIHTHDYAKAQEWYGKLATMKNPKPDILLKYGEVLKINGKYKEAKKWFQEYGKAGGDAERAALLAESCDKAPEILQDSLRYRIMNMPFNSAQSDIVALPFGKGLIYTSARRRGGFAHAVNSRNNNLFYDIFYTEKKAGKGYTRPKHLKGNIHTRFHDGPLTLNKKEDKMYFTRSNYMTGKLNRSKNGRNHLTIMSAVHTGRKWKVAEVLPFNSDEYSCGHPSLSYDEKILVFASDMPGGMGKTDLWMVKWENGKWSKPINLGPEVNTHGDEFFPELAKDGTLYFSSNGQLGLGGLDIFSAAFNNNKWSNVKNVGYPVNSSADDFGLNFIGSTNKGYFSSNRDGGEGQDDIYWFEQYSAVMLQLVDSRSGAPVEDANVELLAGTKTYTYTTDENGMCTYYTKPGKELFITANKTKFKESKERVSTKDIPMGGEKLVTIRLVKDLQYVVEGQVIEAETRNGLPAAYVELFGEYDTTKVVADAQGKYSAELKPSSDYFVLLEKENYIPKVAEVTTREKESGAEFEVNAALKKGDYYLVDGTVIREGTEMPLKGINVRAISMDTQDELLNFTTRRDGKFMIVLDKASASGFYLIASGEGFFSNRVDVVPRDSTQKNVKVRMTMTEYGLDKIVKTIYYDYNKSDLRIISQKDLNEIVYFMLENPEASVELSSHTDSRGSAGYNYRLSQQRSDHVLDFVLKKGIAPERLVAKGYGEASLANKCVDGATCTEEEHQLNRRTEIKVIKLEPKTE